MIPVCPRRRGSDLPEHGRCAQAKHAATTPRAADATWRPPSYWPFVVPALIVVLAVIIFPWLFTLWMSLHDWKIGAADRFVGLANYMRLPNDPRFVEAVWHTLFYTVLAVLLPLILGTLRGRRVSPRSFRCAACCAASSSCR